MPDRHRQEPDRRARRSTTARCGSSPLRAPAPWRHRRGSASGRHVGPDRLSAGQRRDLLEIVEDRHGRGSMLITSRLPVGHEVVASRPLGDATLDRIVHNAYRLEFDGPSMKIQGKPPKGSKEMRRQTQHPGRPRGSTGSSRPRRCVGHNGTSRRARVPPADSHRV
jgi:hypothetical protein